MGGGRSVCQLDIAQSPLCSFWWTGTKGSILCLHLLPSDPAVVGQVCGHHGNPVQGGDDFSWQNPDPVPLYYKYVVSAAATNVLASARWSVASMFVQLRLQLFISFNLHDVSHSKSPLYDGT